MKIKYCLAILSLILLPAAPLSAEPALPVRHILEVSIDPAAGRIDCVDSVTEAAWDADTRIEFTILGGLDVALISPGSSLTLIARGESAPDAGMDRDTGEDKGALVDRYGIEFKKGFSPSEPIVLRYGGRIFFPVKESQASYARGFSETPGIISGEGVYLAGSTHWIPSFGEGLVTFRLTVSLPEGWDAVSQGSRTLHSLGGGKRKTRWDSPEPMEEVYLVAGRFHEYSRSAGAVEVMAFLRTPDEGLAGRYLEATIQYLETFRDLIGVYPYPKFALVENFWETGYGMPSFTLLGETVIRLPFILHSSYPHELLHNWWGNGVYVDFSSGNWCEGLTAYLADHLIKEQRGQGAEYRRDALQKYTDYVDVENDFPLEKFVSRRDAPTEAVGYGKCMMMFNMLRLRTGDEAFKEGMRSFYRDHRYRAASFNDLRLAFESASGIDLVPFFRQWTERTGAPRLRLRGARAAGSDGGYLLSLDLAQEQREDPFTLDVPVAVSFADSISIINLAMESKSGTYEIGFRDRPLYVLVDPQFDLFRRLHSDEIPPSLSKAFGADSILVILPSGEDPLLEAAYARIASVWSEDPSRRVGIARDVDFKTLPQGLAVWIMGWRNVHRRIIEDGMRNLGGRIIGDSVEVGGEGLAREGNSIVISVRDPSDPSSVVIWMSLGCPEAADGLVTKLPHYGKYSYLAFEGTEPANIIKGQWETPGSPMESAVAFMDGKPVGGGSRSLPKRGPLVKQAQVFSGQRMMADINNLADPGMEGRAPGSAGIEKAAGYIAGAFRGAGLEPGGEGGSYFQEWEGVIGLEGKKGRLKNVIGVLRGRGWEGAERGSLVVSAHYDHIGRGWPDVRKGNEGKVHPGADDNASGVAVMLELARALAAGDAPARDIVFAAFTGEESGLQGSRRFVSDQGGFPLSGCIGNINLDTIGRLGGRKVLILDSASAREWKFIFIGSSYVTGIESETPLEVRGSSDQAPFIEAGVPAVQVFAGPHEEYHTPDDTPDRIDPSGLVKVASLVREAVIYLADRKEPLTFTGEKAGAGSGEPSAAGGPAGASGEAGRTERPVPGREAARRAATGCMPDFSYTGRGVRVAGVAPGSPADGAGILAGDIIVALAGSEVNNLKGYSAILSRLDPGNEVTIAILRGGEKINVTIILSNR